MADMPSPAFDRQEEFLVNALLALSRAIDAMSERIGRTIYWLVLVVVLISAANATVRKAFNYSSNAYLEIQWYLFSVIFLFPMAFVIMWFSWPLFMDSYTRNEVSTNAGGLTIWPARLLVPVGFFLLIVQGASELIKRIAFLRGRIPNPLEKVYAKTAEEELAEEIARQREQAEEAARQKLAEGNKP